MINQLNTEYAADHWEGFGVKLKFDPINRSRTDDDDNVMGIYYLEQPLMWRLFNEEIKITVSTTQGRIDFLDVGTGSGFWAIVLTRNFGGFALGIDKSRRACSIAAINVEKNGLEGQVTLSHETYGVYSCSRKSAKCIILTPPYHIYPPEISSFVPQHARGGMYGFETFMSQVKISDYHLADGGSIFFNLMCVGNEIPEVIRLIPEVISGRCQITYINILRPIKTLKFLSEVYQGKYETFANKISSEYKYIYYINGKITRGGISGVSSENVPNDMLCGQSWDERIELHREIYKHALPKEGG